MKSYDSHSSKETEQIAFEFAKRLVPGDVVAFLGTLGAGKTAFTRGLAKGLGAGGEVSSPTFSLIHEYPGAIPLYHFDMYRITDYDDLYSTGFFDYLESDGILAIEWSENIEAVLPDSAIYIEMIPTGEQDRKIKIYDRGEYARSEKETDL